MRLIFKPFFLWGAFWSPGYALRAAQRLMCTLSMQFPGAVEYLKRFGKQRRGDQGGGRSPSDTIFAILDRARAIPHSKGNASRTRSAPSFARCCARGALRDFAKIPCILRQFPTAPGPRCRAAASPRSSRWRISGRSTSTGSRSSGSSPRAPTGGASAAPGKYSVF